MALALRWNRHAPDPLPCEAHSARIVGIEPACAFTASTAISGDVRGRCSGSEHACHEALHLVPTVTRSTRTRREIRGRRCARLSTPGRSMLQMCLASVMFERSTLGWGIGDADRQQVGSRRAHGSATTPTMTPNGSLSAPAICRRVEGALSYDPPSTSTGKHYVRFTRKGGPGPSLPGRYTQGQPTSLGRGRRPIQSIPSVRRVARQPLLVAKAICPLAGAVSVDRAGDLPRNGGPL